MSENSVPALKRGLDLLELISSKCPSGFNQLQQESGLNTSSLNRLLKVLVENDYITKNAEGKYELGMKLFAITYESSEWQPLMHNVSEILCKLSEQFSVTAVMVVFLQSGSHFLDKVVCADNVAMREIGNTAKDYTRNPWGCLYLAQLSKNERQKYIEPVRMNQTDRLIEFAIENGYADDQAVITPNMRRIAAPIYGNNGRLAAALVIGSFANIIDDSKAVSIAAALMKNASILSKIIQGVKHE